MEESTEVNNTSTKKRKKKKKKTDQAGLDTTDQAGLVTSGSNFLIKKEDVEDDGESQDPEIDNIHQDKPIELVANEVNVVTRRRNNESTIDIETNKKLEDPEIYDINHQDESVIEKVDILNNESVTDFEIIRKSEDHEIYSAQPTTASVANEVTQKRNNENKIDAKTNEKLEGPEINSIQSKNQAELVVDKNYIINNEGITDLKIEEANEISVATKEYYYESTMNLEVNEVLQGIEIYNTRNHLTKEDEGKNTIDTTMMDGLKDLEIHSTQPITESVPNEVNIVTKERNNEIVIDIETKEVSKDFKIYDTKEQIELVTNEINLSTKEYCDESITDSKMNEKLKEIEIESLQPMNQTALVVDDENNINPLTKDGLNGTEIHGTQLIKGTESVANENHIVAEDSSNENIIDTNTKEESEGLEIHITEEEPEIKTENILEKRVNVLNNEEEIINEAPAVSSINKNKELKELSDTVHHQRLEESIKKTKCDEIGSVHQGSLNNVTKDPSLETNYTYNNTKCIILVFGGIFILFIILRICSKGNLNKALT